MFSGMVIDELFEIVERAEVHAEESSHSFEIKAHDDARVIFHGFMAEMSQQNQGWMGVA